ncbi:MAG: DUF3791 domain-containing protein [Thermoguttaceae bacterium]
MDIEEAILPFKISELVAYIGKKKKLSVVDSLQYLADTELYKKLHDRETKYWYESASLLYQAIQKEKKQQLKKVKKEHGLWICFCVENYQRLRKKEVEDVLFLFAKTNVYDFLIESYDVLHTQGRNYIIDEIEQYIQNQR